MADLEKLVCDSLESFLNSIGRTVPTMDGRTRPISDLGLESDDEVEWLCDLEELGLRVPSNFRAFVTEDGTCMRSIREIAELLEGYQTGNVRAE